MDHKTIAFLSFASNSQLLDYLVRKYRAQNGRVGAPGALLGQPLYAAFYYECGRAGACDVKHEHATFFLVTDEDRAAFPELGAAYGVGLQDTKAGPIETMLFASKAEYDDYLGLDETSEPLEDK